MTNKRKRSKFPALNKNLNLKIRHEFTDYDYVDKLSPKEKEFLNSFTEEYYNANFKHEGKRVHKKKLATRIIKTTKKEKIYDVYEKDSYDRNNKRNNDVQGINKMNSTLKEFDPKNKELHIGKRSTVVNETEDALIEVLDEDTLLTNKLEDFDDSGSETN